MSITDKARHRHSVAGLAKREAAQSTAKTLHYRAVHSLNAWHATVPASSHCTKGLLPASLAGSTSSWRHRDLYYLMLTALSCLLIVLGCKARLWPQLHLPAGRLLLRNAVDVAGVENDLTGGHADHLHAVAPSINMLTTADP